MTRKPKLVDFFWLFVLIAAGLLFVYVIYLLVLQWEQSSLRQQMF